MEILVLGDLEANLASLDQEACLVKKEEKVYSCINLHTDYNIYTECLNPIML